MLTVRTPTLTPASPTCRQFVDGGMVLPGTVDLDRLYKPDGLFLGFADDPITITGDVAQVDLLVSLTSSQSAADG